MNAKKTLSIIGFLVLLFLMVGKVSAQKQEAFGNLDTDCSIELCANGQPKYASGGATR